MWAAVTTWKQASTRAAVASHTLRWIGSEKKRFRSLGGEKAGAAVVWLAMRPTLSDTSAKTTSAAASQSRCGRGASGAAATAGIIGGDTAPPLVVRPVTYVTDRGSATSANRPGQGQPAPPHPRVRGGRLRG